MQRLAKALEGKRRHLLGHDGIIHERPSLVTDEDRAWLGSRLETRGEVNRAPDDGVVHAVLAPEVPDRAEAGIDAHPCAEGTVKTTLSPLAVELGDTLLHFDSHRHADLGVLCYTPGFRVTKESYDRVPNKFV
jgi:hypothetical protein